MQRFNRKVCYPSRKTLLNAIAECSRIRQVKRVHARIVATGLHQCSVVQAKLVRKLTELGVPTETYAQPIFDLVEEPNPFLWTALIRGYALEGRVSVAAGLYCRMRRVGSVPLSFTLSALFKACAGAGDVGLGREFHGQMVLVGGFVSDLHAGNSLIDMYAKCGHLDSARKVFDEMPMRDAVSWTELIAAYAKSGDMDTAEALFEDSPAKGDHMTWTAMVTAYAHNSRPRDALAAFERMRSEGVRFNGVTLAGVISACASLGASSYARWIRVVAETSGFGPRRDVFVGSAMVHMLSKCGSLDEALAVFDAMEDRNVVTYTVMIAGLATHGRAPAAIRLLREMGRSGVRPNRATFVGLLSACGHSGLVGEGIEIFSAMEGEHGVAPAVEHYSCLVDMLGRAGRLEEALGVVRAMPVDPNGTVWGAVLAASRAHGDLGIARIAAERLLELEPDEPGTYVAVAGAYASARMWDQVSQTRGAMRERKMRKNPGVSWVEARRGEIYEFFSGGATSGEIEETLENLFGRLGYEPDLRCVSYDVSDEDKARLLRTHSEKLALAYGLVTTRDGSVVKIMKNLRICGDCHAFMCGASRLTGREIVVRDNMRFHHFRNGTCSCANYW